MVTCNEFGEIYFLMSMLKYSHSISAENVVSEEFLNEMKLEQNNGQHCAAEKIE